MLGVLLRPTSSCFIDKIITSYILCNMKTAMLNVKIDPIIKREAQKVADELGFSLSAIVNASLKNLARTKTISYSLLEPTPTLAKAIKESKAERKISKPKVFTDADSMMADLMS